jgi:hypothetical protein
MFAPTVGKAIRQIRTEMGPVAIKYQMFKVRQIDSDGVVWKLGFCDEQFFDELGWEATAAEKAAPRRDRKDALKDIIALVQAIEGVKVTEDNAWW